MREQLRATWGSVSLPKETLACRLEQAEIEPPTFQINKWTALPLALHPYSVTLLILSPQWGGILALSFSYYYFGSLGFWTLLWFSQHESGWGLWLGHCYTLAPFPILHTLIDLPRIATTWLESTDFPLQYVAVIITIRPSVLRRN